MGCAPSNRGGGEGYSRYQYCVVLNVQNGSYCASLAYGVPFVSKSLDLLNKIWFSKQCYYLSNYALFKLLATACCLGVCHILWPQSHQSLANLWPCHPRRRLLLSITIDYCWQLRHSCRGDGYFARIAASQGIVHRIMWQVLNSFRVKVDRWV